MSNLQLRRSIRIGTDISIKAHNNAGQLLVMFNDYTSIIEYDERIKHILKIYKLLNFNFDLYYNETRLLKRIYITSFTYFKEAVLYRSKYNKLIFQLYKEFIKCK